MTPLHDDPAEPQRRLSQLTDREREVLALIGEGLANAEIARRLGRTVKTVETHISNLRRKLGVHDRLRLGRLAAPATGATAVDGGAPASPRAANLAVRERVSRHEAATAALRAIDAAVSTATGPEFLDALVAALGSALRLRAAAILARVERGPETWLESIAASAAGEPIRIPPIPIERDAPLRFARVHDAQGHPIGVSVISALPTSTAGGPDSTSDRSPVPGQGATPGPQLIVAPLDADTATVGVLALLADGDFDDRLEPELLLRTQVDRAAAELVRHVRDTGLEVVVDSVVDMLSVHAPSGAYTFVSPSCEELLGYRPDELLGRSAYDFMDSRDIATVGQVHHEVLTDADIVRVRYTLRHKSGRAVDVESQTRAVRGPDGAITGLVCVTRDANARFHGADPPDASEVEIARLAAERDAVERRWRAVCEKVSDYVVIVDPQMRIIYINRTLPELTVDEVVGTTADEHLDPGHDHALELTREVIRTGKPQQTEFESVGAGGRVRWGATIWPLVEDGTIRGAISIVRDLRGQREIESALLESERRYRMLFEDSPEGLLVHDGEHVRMANRRVAELLGYGDPAQLIGVPIVELVEPPFRDLVRQRVAELLRGTLSQPRVRRTFLRHDGTTVALDVAARACTYQGQPAVQTSMRPVLEIGAEPSVPVGRDG